MSITKSVDLIKIKSVTGSKKPSYFEKKMCTSLKEDYQSIFQCPIGFNCILPPFLGIPGSCVVAG